MSATRCRPPLAMLLLLTSLSAGMAFADEPRPAGWLGVMLGGARSAADDGSGGVVIRLIAEKSPAARAGLRARDVILSVNGVRVKSSGELLSQLKSLAPGDWVPVSISRRGDEREVRVRLGTRPTDPRGLRLRRGWIGVRAIDLPPSLREHFGAPEDAGTMISEIAEASPAEAAGFELGDVVFALDGQPVKSGDDLERQVAGAGVGNEVELTLARQGAELVLELVVEAAPSEDPGR